MGVAGMVMSSGYDALWYPVCYACGYLFLLLFIAGPLRRFGAYTIPGFRRRPVRLAGVPQDRRRVRAVHRVFLHDAADERRGDDAGLHFPGLPYWVGVVLVGAVITLNVALGGMKGITLVQAFQYWAKMFAISVPIFVLMAVYGHYGKQLETLFAPLHLLAHHRAGLRHGGVAAHSRALLHQPRRRRRQAHHHVGDDSHRRVLSVFPPVFGVMGRNLLPELYAGVGAKGTDKVVLELPRILE